MTVYSFVVTFLCMKIITASICGTEYVFGPEGEIKFGTVDLFRKNCTWIISPPNDSVTTIRILDLNLEDCWSFNRCCFKITDNENVLFDLCNDKINHPVVLNSNKQNITVVVEAVNIYLRIWIRFLSRSSDKCTNFDYQCLDNSGCYNSTQLCSDNGFICNDRSDLQGCSPCNSTAAICNRFSNQCYDILKRCDGILDCNSGEDELNCSSLCPHEIKCPLENKCFSLSQICDFIYDCSDGFDERDCLQQNHGLRNFAITIMFLLCSVGCMIFLCFLFRWIIQKRENTRFLHNIPEFPLQPFEGPGDSNEEYEQNDLLDTEFVQGGEIFEHYMVAVRRKDSCCPRSSQAGTGIIPKYSHLDLDGDNELVVLASLNVPTDMCVGLNVPETSKEKLETIKSISERASSISSANVRSKRNSKCANVSHIFGPSSSMPSTSLADTYHQIDTRNVKTRRRRRSKSSSFSEASVEPEPTKFVTTAFIEKSKEQMPNIQVPVTRHAWRSPPKQFESFDELREIKVKEPAQAPAQAPSQAQAPASVPVPIESAQWLDIDDDSRYKTITRRPLHRNPFSPRSPRTSASASKRRIGYLCNNKLKRSNNWV
ncbi:unnamed protein product [Phyllotreta striolata]|uniref:Uncharacterized protein n=1 Tax=Phyllotreta striolata TaxID=444603 RepID=A0A9P0DUQ4_PHYSR|nr:unnamed protein product [Phyllotreta striolata]